MSTTSAREFSNLVVHGISLNQAQRTRLEPYFAQIAHVPNHKDPVPDADLAAADVVYGFPIDNIKSAAQVPRLQFIQLASAGAEFLLAGPLWKDEDAKRIEIACTAGAHIIPIPQHFIMTTLALFHRLQEQMLISYVRMY